MIRALNVDKLRLEMGEYVLSVQGLHARGGGATLAGADLDVKRGAFVVVGGPPGGGASLLLACIAGACRPDRGRVRFFGYEIRGFAEERVVRMGIARAGDTPRVFGAMTVLETVTVGALLRRRPLALARAHAAGVLARTGLAAHAERRADALAAPDLRRLELARAVATDPQVLLLDEIAGGCDARALDDLRAVLAALHAGGMTIVAATRTPSDFAPLADDVVALDRGVTAGTETHAAVDLLT